MPYEGQRETFQILLTSDVHAAFMDYNYPANVTQPNTGINKLATLIKREKAAFGGETLVMDAGDLMQGNGIGVLMKEHHGTFKPFPLLAAYDVIGYDCVGLGNHEFNNGVPNLLEAFEGYKGSVVCCNVFDEATGGLLPICQPYWLHTLPGGARIAVIGVVTPNIMIWDKKNLAGKYRAENAASATRQILDELLAKDLADVFILLGHMDEDNEMSTPGSGANDVIAMNPELAVFLGAHIHSAKGTKDKQLVLQGTTKFVEDLNAAGSLGKVSITVSYEDGRWQVKNKTGSYDGSDVQTDVLFQANQGRLDGDAGVEAAVRDAHDFMREYMTKTVVGHLTGGPLVPPPEIRGTSELALRPTALNQLVGNVMMHFSGADFAGASPNDPACNCEPGDIKIGDIVKMYAYDNNTLNLVSMTGAQVQKWMEWAYSFYGVPVTLGGGLPPDDAKPAVALETDLTIPYGAWRLHRLDHFTGLDYEVDLTQPVGRRVKIKQFTNGRPFSSSGVYKAAANNYRVATGLTITSAAGIFKEGEETAEVLRTDITSPAGNSDMLDLIAEYIKGQPNQTISNEFSPNWRFVNLAWDAAYRQKAVDAINSGEILYDTRFPVTKAQIDAL